MANKIKVVDKRQEQVIKILSELTEKQISILIMRFTKAQTQKEVGTFFNMTNERVRQLEEQALKIINKNLK